MQTYDKARNALALALSPVVKALIDPDAAMKDIRNLDSVRMISTFFLTHTFLCSFTGLTNIREKQNKEVPILLSREKHCFPTFFHYYIGLINVLISLILVISDVIIGNREKKK